MGEEWAKGDWHLPCSRPGRVGMLPGFCRCRGGGRGAGAGSRPPRPRLCGSIRGVWRGGPRGRASGALSIPRRGLGGVICGAAAATAGLVVRVGAPAAGTAAGLYCTSHTPPAGSWWWMGCWCRPTRRPCRWGWRARRWPPLDGCRVVWARGRGGGGGFVCRGDDPPGLFATARVWGGGGQCLSIRGGGVGWGCWGMECGCGVPLIYFSGGGWLLCAPLYERARCLKSVHA